MLPTTMRAARLHKYGELLHIDGVPVPRPAAGQVLVRVKGAGFCHSDLHVISGDIPILPRMPVTPAGHCRCLTTTSRIRRRRERRGERRADAGRR